MTPEAGDRPPEVVARRLAQAPGDRYRRIEDDSGQSPPSARRQLGIAVAVAVVGAVLLFSVGGPLSSTAGLIAIAALLGASVGLTLAGAAVTAGQDGGTPPLTRSLASRLSVGLSLGAVLVAAVATWLFARSEGGTLGLLDYLWATFGLLVPIEALVASVAASWGARAGPVRR